MLSYIRNSNPLPIFPSLHSQKEERRERQRGRGGRREREGGREGERGSEGERDRVRERTRILVFSYLQKRE